MMNQIFPLRSLFFALVIFVILIRSKSEIFKSSCRNDALFKAMDRNTKLYSSTATITDLIATSLAACSRNCIRAPKCLSINYKKYVSDTEKNCQLLDILKSNSSTQLTAVNEWIHYEPVKQVTNGTISSLV